MQGGLALSSLDRNEQRQTREHFLLFLALLVPSEIVSVSFPLFLQAPPFS